MIVSISLIFLFSIIVFLICGPCIIELQVFYRQLESKIILRILIWKGLYGLEIVNDKISKKVIPVFFKKRLLIHPIGNRQYNNHITYKKVQTTLENIFRNTNIQRNNFLMREIKKMLRIMISKGRANHIWIDGCFGTGNPALTGKIFGLSQMLKIKDQQFLKIRLIPNFIVTKFEGNFVIAFNFYLLSLIFQGFWPFIRIVWILKKIQH